MSTRREFITLLGGAAAALPLAARGQQLGKVLLVGALMPFAEGDEEAERRRNAFQRGLEAFGWTNGQNIRIEYRWVGSDRDRIRTQGEPRMVRRKRPDRVDSAFRLQLIRFPGFHRPIMRVATSGDRRRPFKNAPVKLARPVCKTVPADLRKIPTQCGDIGVVADAVEPFEHERRILALLASRDDWDFLIVDRAADGVREDFRLLLAG
jgi:hypothetical protein